MDRETWTRNMLREYLIIYTIYLNNEFEIKVPVLDAVEGYMDSDKANTDEWVAVIVDPEPYLNLGARKK